LHGGLPHSDIHGSTPARGSPWLFAACHVLHRLLVPRHPPNALLILDIPVLTCQRQTSQTRTSPCTETILRRCPQHATSRRQRRQQRLQPFPGSFRNFTCTQQDPSEPQRCWLPLQPPCVLIRSDRYRASELSPPTAGGPFKHERHTRSDIQPDKRPAIQSRRSAIRNL
jgi:hypothetical protein